MNKVFAALPTRRLVAALLSCALLVGLSACLATTPPAIPEVAVEIADTAITTPATMPAGLVGVTITDRRTQPGEGVPIIARLHEGVTLEEALAADGDPTAAPKATFLGGQLGHSIFNLEPGNYFVMWGGPPGTAGPAPVAFAVTGEPGAQQQPEAAVQLELHDFAYTLPDSVPGGKQLWQITNRGQVGHHALFWRLNEGVGDAEFTAWVTQEEPQGPPPATLVVDWAPTDAGVTSWAELDLAPGTYYLICFLPDFTSDPPTTHLAHGMIRKVTVQELAR